MILYPIPTETNFLSHIAVALGSKGLPFHTNPIEFLQYAGRGFQSHSHHGIGFKVPSEKEMMGCSGIYLEASAVALPVPRLPRRRHASAPTLG